MGALIGDFIKPKSSSAWAPPLLLLFIFLAILSFQFSSKSVFPIGLISSGPGHDHDDPRKSCAGFFGHVALLPRRKVVMSITDFGGVGDGKTSNTETFRKAIRYMQGFGDKGGSQLNVPKGKWLTGSFNLTRQNGTIDGQGKMWWDLWWNRTLEHTRGHLVELMNSHNILISNLTFLNSPFWTIHPVYCSNVLIKDMTILAPLNAPNTDGIDPDSSTNVCIEDCYIESGDDLVAVKSGWDQYGITIARPSSNIIVRRVSGTTPTCSGVGIGSEMSGGISNVTIEDLHVWDSAAGVRIKSDKGRGGYIANISISNITMERVKIPIRFSRGSNDHPDEGWDPKALPIVKGIFISNVVSLNSTKAPVLQGIEGASFEGICFKNVTLLGLAPSKTWQCEFVSGFASEVFPMPCPQLQNNGSSSWCSYS
uniref:Pectate lyase superfamily protein domain-containing protein n=1 Tax=Fagus sylvatica TaxID=28930 RepID=A0A2N9HVC8_FAGSY